MARGLSKERIEMGEVAWAEHIRTMNNDKAKKYRNGQHVVSWHRRTKRKLIEYKGGKCEKCGYDKNCASAFCFHHKNPDEKDFTIASKTWAFERLKKEVDKCMLLCVRCHAEVHEDEYAEIRKVEETVFEERLARASRTTNCKACNTQFKPNNNRHAYCSASCRVRGMYGIKHYPTKEELAPLINAKHSWTELGRKFGASGNAIKKWAISFGIQLPVYRRPITDIECIQCRSMFRPVDRTQKYCSLDCSGKACRKVVLRPSLEELLEMRKTQTRVQIGAFYGVSPCTVQSWEVRYKEKRKMDEGM